MSVQTVEWDELTAAEQAKVIKRREKKNGGGKAKPGGKSRGVHVVWLVDRSGSMGRVQADVVGGFNAFVEDQRKIKAPCRLSLHQFDSTGLGMSFDTVYDAVPLADVREMTLADFQPRGMTPLYDAVGRAVTTTQARADAAKAEDVVVVIFTDGLENSSHEYTAEAVRTLVKAKEEAGWTFTFLGAGIDAYAVGSVIGVSSMNTQKAAADSFGARAVYGSVSDAVGAHRTRAFAGGQSMSTSYFAGTGKGAEDDLNERTATVKK